MTLAELKAKYPNPQSSSGTSPGYCVGGAVQNEAQGEKALSPEKLTKAFPFPEALSFHLQFFNPGLSDRDAGRYARAIICANDCDDFSDAWKLVGEALELE